MLQALGSRLNKSLCFFQSTAICVLRDNCCGSIQLFLRQLFVEAYKLESINFYRETIVNAASAPLKMHKV